MGLSQAEKPAPLGYRRFANAMIICIIPGAIGLVSGWGLPDAVANKWLMVLGFIPALIKGIGMILGNGQVYMPSNEKIDNQSPLNKNKP